MLCVASGDGPPVLTYRTAAGGGNCAHSLAHQLAGAVRIEVQQGCSRVRGEHGKTWQDMARHVAWLLRLVKAGTWEPDRVVSTRCLPRPCELKAIYE